MDPSEPCRICSRSEAPGPAVRLWDGRWYCRECVEAVSPALYRYALAHDRLEESPPFSRGDIWRAGWRLEAWVLLTLAGVPATSPTGVPHLDAILRSRAEDPGRPSSISPG